MKKISLLFLIVISLIHITTKASSANEQESVPAFFTYPDDFPDRIACSNQDENYSVVLVNRIQGKDEGFRVIGLKSASGVLMKFAAKEYFLSDEPNKVFFIEIASAETPREMELSVEKISGKLVITFHLKKTKIVSEDMAFLCDPI